MNVFVWICIYIGRWGGQLFKVFTSLSLGSRSRNLFCSQWRLPTRLRELFHRTLSFALVRSIWHIVFIFVCFFDAVWKGDEKNFFVVVVVCLCWCVAFVSWNLLLTWTSNGWTLIRNKTRFQKRSKDPHSTPTNQKSSEIWRNVVYTWIMKLESRFCFARCLAFLMGTKQQQQILWRYACCITGAATVRIRQAFWSRQGAPRGGSWIA